MHYGAAVLKQVGRQTSSCFSVELLLSCRGRLCGGLTISTNSMTTKQVVGREATGRQTIRNGKLY